MPPKECQVNFRTAWAISVEPGLWEYVGAMVLKFEGLLIAIEFVNEKEEHSSRFFPSKNGVAFVYGKLILIA